jgi:hypothetical protein
MLLSHGTLLTKTGCGTRTLRDNFLIREADSLFRLSNDLPKRGALAAIPVTAAGLGDFLT